MWKLSWAFLGLSWALLGLSGASWGGPGAVMGVVEMLMVVWFHARVPYHAIAVFTTFRRTCFSELYHVKPQCISAGAAIQACVRAAAMSAYQKGDQWQQASELFVIMLGEGVQRDTITHNAAIKVCDKGKQW